MNLLTTFYIGLHLVFWAFMFMMLGKRKPGTREVSWSDREISTWRAISAALVVMGLAALLTGCVGGGDLEDDRKQDPSPNCAMRPETCK